MSFVGVYYPPGDKSITHRALILSAMATGTCRIQNALFAEDTLSTVSCLHQLSVPVGSFSDRNLFVVEGVGKYGFQAPKDDLNCHNSGTTMRLMTGLLAAQPFSSTLVGDASLLLRPMERVVRPLLKMGARIHLSDGGTAPIRIMPSDGLCGITYRMEVPSAQVKSAIQIASCYASHPSNILCEKTMRNHTDILLESYRKQPYISTLMIPGDFSSAAFFIIGALLSEGSDLYVKNVGLNIGRVGLIRVLRRMGAQIDVCDQRHYGGEPVGTIRVRVSSLKACHVLSEEVPSLIDEVPLLAIAAAFAEGRSDIAGLGELRVKESNRLQAISDLLTILRVRHGVERDDLWIEGRATNLLQMSHKELYDIDFHSDHRLSMCRAILGQLAGDCFLQEESVNISYPDFYKDLKQMTMGKNPA